MDFVRRGRADEIAAEVIAMAGIFFGGMVFDQWNRCGLPLLK